MMRSTLAAAALVIAAHAASAQDPLSKAKALANKAVNAENAHTAREQMVEQQAKTAAKTPAKTPAKAQSKATVQQAAKPAAKPATKPDAKPTTKPAAKTAAPAKSAAPAKGGKQQPGTKLELPSDTTPSHVTIMREVFDYESDGRRDPFVSLMNTSELRPALSDLRLTGILYDESGRHSIATLRDLTNNALYRVTVGTTLGRMHVAVIRVKTVVFTIDEFGTTRQDSLFLGDSTKARPR